ncbi:MAG: glycosyltransferase [Clostridia bacterium]|nr:glycosyltransferase [Clostridia bacterium]
MNNIVILSALGGHDVAARAIKEQFDLRYDDCKVIIIPMEEYAGRMLTHINDGFYTFCCRFAPWMFGVYFKFMSARLTRKLRRLGKKYSQHNDGSLIKEESSLFPVKKLKNIYDRFEPKVIVSVQSMPHGLAVAAKKRHKFNSKIVAVISDYALDKLYVRYGCDGYVVDNHEMKKDFKAFNFEDEKIKVYGLSAFNKFLVKNDKEKMRKHFNLPDRKTVIITGGSFGSGKTKDIFEHLIQNFKDINVVVIAGRNEKLKRKLEKIKEKNKAENGFVMGFTTEFDKLLDAADVMICKPGAMSVNESFLKGVPVISVYPMPSVEAANVKYFKEKNLTMCADNPKDVAEKLSILLNDEAKYEEYVTAITNHAKKNATKNIADYIYSLIEK